MSVITWVGLATAMGAGHQRGTDLYTTTAGGSEVYLVCDARYRSSSVCMGRNSKKRKRIWQEDAKKIK